MTPEERAEKIYARMVNPCDPASLRTSSIALIADQIREAEKEAYRSGRASMREEAAEAILDVAGKMLTPPGNLRPDEIARNAIHEIPLEGSEK